MMNKLQQFSLEEEGRQQKFGNNQSFSTYLRQRIAPICVLIAFFATAILLTYWFTESNYKCNDKHFSDDKDDIVIKSVELFSNDSADPCDNFFHFACHKWHQENARTVNHEAESKWPGPPPEKLFETLAELLKSPPEDDDIPAFTQAQQFYNNCLRFQSAKGKESEGTALGALWNLYEESGGRHHSITSAYEVDCVYFVKEIFKFAVANRYLLGIYDTSYIHSILNEVTLMSKQVKDTFNLLQNSSGEEGIDFDRIHNIPICVGFPSWMFNQTRVQEVYSDLSLNQSTFKDQFLNAVVWALRKRIERNVEDEGLNDDNSCNWDTFPVEAFAHFDPALFQIYIPFGDIEPAFRSSGQSRATKYGYLGFTMGHELTHALYALGFKSNKNDSLTRTEKCLVDHYNGFTVNELKNESYFLDGNATLEENFADVAGLHLAFSAFKQNLTTSQRKQQFTMEQEFFLGFANQFCESLSLQDMKDAMHGASHSPNMFRVLGTLQNSREFAKAWNCPKGSNMNPQSSDADKCSVF